MKKAGIRPLLRAVWGGGEDLDNKVGSSTLNFPRIKGIHGDLGATTTVSYGFANACDINSLPSQSSNTRDCYWQKWPPEGETEARTGWFKKFLVKQVEVAPAVTDNQDGAPKMTTSYLYEDGAGWRFTGDPLTEDEDESWSDWRGYQEVQVSTGAGTGKKANAGAAGPGRRRDTPSSLPPSSHPRAPTPHPPRTAAPGTTRRDSVRPRSRAP